MSTIKSVAQSIQAEYKDDFGMDVEVYFHNTRAANIDVDNFKFRSVNVQGKPASGKGLGIFTHTGDEYFNKFGGNIFAVVVQKGFAIVQIEDDVSNKVEVFIPQNRVEEIISL